MRNLELPSEIKRWNEKIESLARSRGLDFYDVVFEMVNYKEMSELAALGGFPQRYPHWRFGMELEKLDTHSTYGLSKIYEMVINNDPTYAYLLTSNSLMEQKLVMAHVYGHADFFKHNRYFNGTDRKMLDTMANHAVRVRKYQERYGVEVVEEFIDQCLSLDNLIDSRTTGRIEDKKAQSSEKSAAQNPAQTVVTPSYMQHFIQPAAKKEAPKENPILNFPERPERDVLLFLMQHAPLEPWQQDVLSIVRAEAYYYVPQAQTKIMNEGWASFWHSRMMTQSILSSSEVIDYAETHAGTMVIPKQGINPYRLGIEIFRDIEDRWNRGRFGRDWEECDDIRLKKSWNKNTGQGLEKVFEVRKLYNDVTFIDTFLTEDFCREQKLFSFGYNSRAQRYEIQSREFKQIKESLLRQLTNFGQPVIEVVDANYKNRSELLLAHRYDGVPLRKDFSESTLRNLFGLWRRPVNIQTQDDEKTVVWSFDGKEFAVT